MTPLSTVEREAEQIADEAIQAARRAAEWANKRQYKAATLKILQYIAEHAIDTMDLNVVILERMSERIINAQSPDDILDPFGTLKGQSLLGKPLVVVGCDFLESDQVEGFPYYVSLMTRDAETGITQPVTVGGEKLVIQAAGLDMHNAWPIAVKIQQSAKATRQGYFPLDLAWGHK